MFPYFRPGNKQGGECFKAGTFDFAYLESINAIIC